MGKLHQLSPELWPLIYVIYFSYIELIFRGGVSFLCPNLVLDFKQIQRFSINGLDYFGCTYN